MKYALKVFSLIKKFVWCGAEGSLIHKEKQSTNGYQYNNNGRSKYCYGVVKRKILCD